MTITTKRGYSYELRAWTGGDKPDIDFAKDEVAQDLIGALIDGQIKDSCGLDFWACAGTSASERLEIFTNRAILDAWRTLHP